MCDALREKKKAFVVLFELILTVFCLSVAGATRKRDGMGNDGDIPLCAASF